MKLSKEREHVHENSSGNATERVGAHYAERIQQNQDQGAREKAAFGDLADGQAARQPEDFPGDRTLWEAGLFAAAYRPASGCGTLGRASELTRTPRPTSTVSANIETADRIFRSCLLPWTLIRRSKLN